MTVDKIRLSTVALVLGLMAPGCGGHSDDAKRPQSDTRLEQAATELDSYLRSHTDDLEGVQTGPQLVSQVESAGGKLKVYVDLNDGVAADAKVARELCRRISASGVPEAEGAMVVDLGDAPMSRC